MEITLEMFKKALELEWRLSQAEEEQIEKEAQNDGK